MKKFIVAIVTTAALLVGCQEEEIEVDTLDNGVMPQEVMVDMLTAETQQVGSVTLEAKVTQGEEAVDDATMQFEVWESGLRDAGVMIEASLTENGVYTAEHTFDHDGVYYMYAHTNARGLHVMPKQEIVVGNPDRSQVLSDDSSDSMEDVPHEDAEAEQSHDH